MLRGFQLLICGLALGWIVGLSASPNLQTILGSIVALVAGTAATASGLVRLKENSLHFNPTFVMCLLLGIALGAPIGIIARTNAYFGSDKIQGGKNDPDWQAPVLFGALSDDEITRLKTADFLEARSIMQTIEKGKYKSFVLSLNSNQVVDLRNLICTFEKSAKTLKITHKQ